MIKGQHGMGLAATEVGLKLHHRIAGLSGHALYSPNQQTVQAFGEIGAAEKFRWLFVFIAAFAYMDLPQVGGKLSLLVASAGHVPVRIHYLAPRLQVSGGLAFNGCPGSFALFATLLLIK